MPMALQTVLLSRVLRHGLCWQTVYLSAQRRALPAGRAGPLLVAVRNHRDGIGGGTLTVPLLVYCNFPIHQAFGDVASDRFPGAVLPRRRSPGYRRQDSHSFVGLCHAVRRYLLVQAATAINDVRHVAFTLFLFIAEG